MNTEDFVTYEQAVELHGTGFDEPCRYYYNSKQRLVCAKTCALSSGTTNNRYLAEIADGIATAPTLEQVAKWLREVKGLFINVWLCAAGYGWTIEKCGNLNCNGTFVAQHDEESGDDEDSGMFTTYEKALSAGIDVALELLTTSATFVKH